MTWKETLNQVFALPGSQTSLEFYPPVSEQDIALAQHQLQVGFPQDLKGLFAETNGVGLHLHLDKPDDDVLIGFLIWPFERIVADNITFRTDRQITQVYMPFDGLLFFSDAGNGDLFGFAITSLPKHVDRIYRWDHEDDSRICVARSLRDFVQFMAK